MLNYISGKVLNSLTKDNAIDMELVEVYDYGIKILLLNICGILNSVFIGILFNEIPETFVFLIFFVLTRRYSGGYHAKKIWKCSLMTSSTLISIFVLHKFFNFSIITYICVFSISAMIFIKLTPVENENKPLKNNIKSKCKKVSLLLLFIQFIFGLILYIANYEIYEIVLLTVLFVSLFVILATFKGRREVNEKSI